MSKESQMLLLGVLYLAIAGALLVAFALLADLAVGGLNPFGGPLAETPTQVAAGVLCGVAAFALGWPLAKRALAAIVG